MILANETKLLLLQSEPVLAELTSYRLELLGYPIEVYRTSAEANDAIRDETPDLAIVDTTLADGDGIEWLALIRNEYSPEQLPALVFSQDPTLDTVQRAFIAGAQDYLLTPYDPRVLEEKIEKILSRQPQSSA